MTATATLSSKFQISIPKAVREEQLARRSEFVFVSKGKGVLVMPVPDIRELAGIARGAQDRLSGSKRSGLMAARSRVVDTSAWIEWLVGSELGKQLGREFPDRSRWIVPTVVQLELAKWLTRESFDDEGDGVIAFTQKCVVVTLDTTLALAAADLHRLHGLATADAIVLATARAHGADLLTCDAHFGALPDVVYVAKPARR